MNRKEKIKKLLKEYMYEINFLEESGWFLKCEEEFKEDFYLELVEDFDLEIEEAKEQVEERLKLSEAEWVSLYVLRHLDLETLEEIYKFKDELILGIDKSKIKR